MQEGGIDREDPPPSYKNFYFFVFTFVFLSFRQRTSASRL